MPARALGLTWAKVDPGARDLDVSLGVVDEMRPRQAMTIPVAIGNLPAGTEAFVTVAAVDVGILNLTNFQPPAPDDWYFGQRKLGMDIRDLYGLLIDRMQGVPGVIRSGGDGGPARLAAPPPTEKLVAFYSGIVAVGPDGKASVSFDMPEFNGTVRVMAMAWSKTGVGHAVKDVLVRDPVVVTASLPQFLAAGDTSRLLVEVNNVAGPAGDYKLSVETDGHRHDAEDFEPHRRRSRRRSGSASIMPISGPKVGDFSIKVSLASPSGEVWPKELALGVRPAGMPVTRRNLVAAERRRRAHRRQGTAVGVRAGNRVGRGVDRRCEPARRRRHPLGARPLPLWLRRADHQPGDAARLSRRRRDHGRDRVGQGGQGARPEGDRRPPGGPGGERQLRPLGSVRHGQPLARCLRHRLPHPGRGEGLRRAQARPATSPSTTSPTGSPTPRTSSAAARTSPMRSTCWRGRDGPRSATFATTRRPRSAASARRSPRRRSGRRSPSMATGSGPATPSARPSPTSPSPRTTTASGAATTERRFATRRRC